MWESNVHAWVKPSPSARWNSSISAAGGRVGLERQAEVHAQVAATQSSAASARASRAPTAPGPPPTVSSSFVWLTPPMLRDEHHHGRHHARHLGGVVQRAARQAGRRCAGEVLDHARRRSRPARRRRHRLLRELRDPLDLAALLGGDALRRLARLGDHLGEHPRVERRAGRARARTCPLNAVTIPGATATIPVVARMSSRPRGALAEGQRAAGRGEEGVAAQVHRRRRRRGRARRGSARAWRWRPKTPRHHARAAGRCARARAPARCAARGRRPTPSQLGAGLEHAGRGRRRGRRARRAARPRRGR